MAEQHVVLLYMAIIADIRTERCVQKKKKKDGTAAVFCVRCSFTCTTIVFWVSGDGVLVQTHSWCPCAIWRFAVVSASGPCRHVTLA